MKRAIFFFSLSLVFSPFIEGSILKNPPKKQTSLSFQQLPCSSDQEKKIRKLVKILGKENWFGLLSQQEELLTLGTEISEVHPLKFLSIIFQDPMSRESMVFVWKDFLKWGRFMDDLSRALEREAKGGTLLIYLDDFAKAVHHPSEVLQPFLKDAKWNEMVEFLIGLDSSF